MKSFRFYIDIKAENKEEAQSKLEESDGYSPDFDNLECIELQIEYPIDKQTMTDKIHLIHEDSDEGNSLKKTILDFDPSSVVMLTASLPPSSGLAAQSIVLPPL